MSAYFSTTELNHFLATSSRSAIHFNARSIRKNYDAIHDLLSTLSNSFPITAITETWLNESDKDLFSFPLYASEYCHRGSSNHGGAAIYVSKLHTYKRRFDLDLKITDCESVWVEFNDSFLSIDNKNLIFGCIYRSPSSCVIDFCSALQHTMNSLSFQSSNVIIVGDININLLDSSSTSCLNYISSFHAFGFENLISVPTRCTADNSNTLIDHALSNLICPPDAGVLNIDITDHYPIFIRFSTKPRQSNIIYTKVVLDKERFLSAVTSTDWSSIISIHDPQQAFSQFLNQITLYINSHSQIHKCKRKYSSPQNPWITNTLLNEMRKKENLYKKTKRQPFNSKLLNRYKKLSNDLAAKLRRAKKVYFEHRILSCGNNTKKKWDIVNSFLSRNTSSEQISKIEHDNILYTDPKGIGDAFIDYFVNDNPTSAHNYFAPAYNRLPHSFYLFPTTPQEIIDTIHHLKPTSPGLDGINSVDIKLIAHIICDALSHIVNLMFKTGIFPEELKRGKIIPVFKKGDRSRLTNYRPICILSFFSKVTEKLIETRLTKYLKNSILFLLISSVFAKDFQRS